MSPEIEQASRWIEAHTKQEAPMEQEAISDLEFLESYFKELESWPSGYTITAPMWPVVSQRVKDALEADLSSVGYRPEQVYAVEYENGELIRVTVPIRR